MIVETSEETTADFDGILLSTDQDLPFKMEIQVLLTHSQ